MLIGSFLRVAPDRVINLAQIVQVYIDETTSASTFVVVQFGFWDQFNGEEPWSDYFDIDSPEARVIMSHFGLEPIEEEEIKE